MVSVDLEIGRGVEPSSSGGQDGGETEALIEVESKARKKLMSL